MRTTAAKTLYRHWQDQRGTRPAPDRRAMDPVALGACLPDVFLLERRDGKIRFRLAGTRVCNIFGAELRGLDFEHLFDPCATEDVSQVLGMVLDHGDGIIGGVSALYPDRISLDGEIMLLPLTNEAGADGSDRLIGVLSIAGHRPQALPACMALDLVTFRVIADSENIAVSESSFPGPARTVVELAGQRRSRFVVHDGGLR